MPETRDYREGLVLLHRLPTSPARRAAFRSSLASLALAASERQPVPLEGLDPDALLAGLRAALADGLLDELDWLSPPSAAVALYEIANALPIGQERRELGRRVVRALHDGNAATFVAIATSLALGARKGLRGRGVRARLALSLELPTSEAPGCDALALALVSRSDLFREWVQAPAKGNLPARRMAATLLERAAIEAATLAAQGSPDALRVFSLDEVSAVFRRLLDDRATRVFHPIARARGVLATALGDFQLEVRRDLDESAGAKAWRRGAVSLASSIAMQPSAVDEVLALLDGPLFANDRKLAAAIVGGVRRVVESEPDACRRVLEEVARVGGLDAFDALVELHLSTRDGAVVERALAVARDRVLALLDRDLSDPGAIAWVEALERDLSPREERGEPSLRERVREALRIFAERGAMAAYDEAEAIVEVVGERLDALEGVADDTPEGRRRAFHLVRELDDALLELGVFGELLALRARDEHDEAPELDGWLDRLADWLGAREFQPSPERPSDAQLRAAQLRALLHLSDLDGGEGPEATDRTRLRRLRTFRMLLHRARAEAASPFRALVLEALARASDAVVRDEGTEVCDVLIALAMELRDASELSAVADASVVTELKNALSVYSELLRAAAAASTSASGVHAFADVVLARTREMPSASSPRLEALRSSLQRFARGASLVVSAECLGELRDDAHEPLLARLGAPVQTIAQLVAGAQRRRGERVARALPASGVRILALDHVLERRAASESVPVAEELEACVRALSAELPEAIARVAAFALRHAAGLPLRASMPDDRGSIPSLSAFPVRDTPLPSWIPPRRTLGGFYVLHPLGVGGAASVFVAKRVEERFDDRAERFALKVPAYSGAHARTLSEEAFLQLFREEAGALLALPAHPNLARFVTFDSGVKPKPILVMEYVEGPTLGRLLERKRMTTSRALRVLDGVAAGLSAMHGVGIGHLDLKPSNVVLRRDEHGEETPVLVDFGLAGRLLRPGCATLEYGAPEVFGLHEGPSLPSAADVYAFGALAYELLVGETLFSGPDESAVIVAHGTHDGDPPGVVRLRDDAGLAPLAEVLASALRRDPGARASIDEVRAGLAAAGEELASRAWPLA